MPSDRLCELSLREAAELVRKKQVSPVELTRACLDRIEREDKSLNSFISVFGDEALDQAGEAELEISRNGWRGPLHGIPIAIKDLIDMRGKVTTAASAVLRENVAAEDAEVVGRLRQAGAVFIGKNNLHEFAYGGSGIVSHYGPPRNPIDPTRITGGSSSGSAAAVAAGFCFAAIGTDTAGSIRLPAACCGVVGLKPGYAEVSAHGIVPLSWSYDHVGPLARIVEDAFLVLQAISDWTPREIDVRGLRVGIARNYFFADVDFEIAGAVERAVSSLASRCSSVQEVTVPIDEDRTVFSSEAWQFHEKWGREKPELYQPQTLARIKVGEKHAPALVEEKRRELVAMRAKAAELFRDVDVIVTPTAPIIPPTFSELEGNPESLRPKELLMLRNTRLWNVLGVPAISIPCGRMMGVQLAALNENTLWAAARAIQAEG
jgi:aspartyl-tRNA(Asn)/glutamyl-tRNA(Gln) amidotransferase subunit A